MSNIYDLANELSRGIRDLPEYKAVLASKEAIDADADAKGVIRRLPGFPTRNSWSHPVWTNANRRPTKEDAGLCWEITRKPNCK